MADSADPVVVRELDIQASPHTVFEFFVDAEKLTRWLAVEATLEPRPGGECTQVHAPSGDGGPRYHMRGRFIAVDRPRRVLFTWGFVEPGLGIPVGSSTVELTLSAIPDGTRVRLEHRGLPSPYVEDHAKGWAEMLDLMAGEAVREAQSRR